MIYGIPVPLAVTETLKKEIVSLTEVLLSRNVNLTNVKQSLLDGTQSVAPTMALVSRDALNGPLYIPLKVLLLFLHNQVISEHLHFRLKVGLMLLFMINLVANAVIFRPWYFLIAF